MAVFQRPGRSALPATPPMATLWLGLQTDGRGKARAAAAEGHRQIHERGIETKLIDFLAIPTQNKMGLLNLKHQRQGSSEFYTRES
jgi:hypothetical protein